MVMDKAIELLALSNDFTVSRALEFLFEELSDTVEASAPELLKKLPVDGLFLGDEDFLNVVRNNGSLQTDKKNSIILSRRMLLHFAKSEFATLLFDALANKNTDNNEAEACVSLGMIASLFLIIVSAEVDYQGENFRIHKNDIQEKDLLETSKLVQSLLWQEKNN